MTSGLPVVAAIDVGGTRIKGSLGDRDYAVVAQTTTPTPADIAGDIASAVAAVVDQLFEQVVDQLFEQVVDGGGAQVLACGVVVPGVVDSAPCIGVRSVNLGWPSRSSWVTTSGPDCSRRPVSARPAARGR